MKLSQHVCAVDLVKEKSDDASGHQDAWVKCAGYHLTHQHRSILESKVEWLDYSIIAAA